jgi:dolichol-phosphate mannosyltransferase
MSSSVATEKVVTLWPRSTEGKVLSVVVPVYCEQGLIYEVHRRMKSAFSALESRGMRLELIFVNDGSHDATLTELLEVARDDSTVRVIDLSRNFGHQRAITAGTDLATGDVVVVIDGDLQDPPEVVPLMIDKWAEGYGVVYGMRLHREGESKFKLATAKAFYRIINWLSDIDLPLDTGDFRLMDRAVVDSLNDMREESRYVRGMVTWIGFPQYALPYERDRRYAGSTKYTLSKMARLAVDGLTSFTSRPLGLAGQFGAIVTTMAFLFLVYIIIGRFAFPGTVQSGWTSVLAAVLFLGGVQLMSIGLLGSYLGRIFYESKRRPLYIVAGEFSANDGWADASRHDTSASAAQPVQTSAKDAE